MSTWPKLSASPIVEGLIDIRVEPAAGADLLKIKAASDDLAAEFPSRQDMHMFVAQFNLAPELGATTMTTGDGPRGVVLRSVDDKWVVQFRLDGMTVSRLQPYCSWKDLVEKASTLWALYSAAAKPFKIVRVATRFLNRVPLPVGESLERTFLTNFAIGPALPQAVAGYLLRVVLPFEDQRAVAVVTQSLEANGTECILDLDVFSERPDGVADAEVWSELGRLREVKNRLFFGSLTETALERFR